MAANFNVRKTCSTVERMVGCEYSIKIIVVPFINIEYIAGTNFFGNKNTTAKRITQTMDHGKFFFQNKCSNLQRMDECHSYSDESRYITSRDGWLQLEW